MLWDEYKMASLDRRRFFNELILRVRHLDQICKLSIQ
jgi:hypothetical protein